jgi:hypothetical protein
MLKPIRRDHEMPVARALQFGASDAHALVDVCYHAILGRAPDPRGLSAYADLIGRTPDRETLIAVVRSLAMSEEAREYREHHLATVR